MSLPEPPDPSALEGPAPVALGHGTGQPGGAGKDEVAGQDGRRQQEGGAGQEESDVEEFDECVTCCD